MLWILSLLLMFQGLLSNSQLLLGCSGLVLGIAVLTKPIFLYYEAICLLMILLSKKYHIRRLMILAVIHLSCFIIILIPWCTRNFIVWNKVLLTPNGGSHLYHFIRPMLLTELNKEIYDETQLLNGGYKDIRVPKTKEEWAKKFGSSWDNLAYRNAVLGQLAAEDIKANIGTYICLIIKRHPRLYIGTGTRTMAAIDRTAEPVNLSSTSVKDELNWLYKSRWLKYQIIMWIFLGITYIFAVNGFFAAKKYKHHELLTWSILTLVYFVVIIGPFYHTRYRFFMMAAFAALASCGGFSILSKFRKISQE